MDSIKFPKKKPASMLELPVDQLSKLATQVSKSSLTAQLEILSAETPEELAIAIAKFHGALSEAAAAWTTFADQTRPWAH